MTTRALAPPPVRRLRVYAFDPHLDTQMETAVINHMTVAVPWEQLEVGPVGEYLEVVDADPASACFYAPVDLNDPYLLAEDGLPPGEGNPQFHQQMAYAVASLTIRNFERALGRRALWSPRRVTTTEGGKRRTDEVYVQRLRLYPHALREANSFYDPNKKALLLGYFPAGAGDLGRTLPGGTVFCCLSHDIIAHETTHALLDGIHRRFIEPTNPDVLAFHEAFADLVAMLQHFTFPEVLRHQIAQTAGDLASQNLLGQLAQEFGVARGMHGALREPLWAYDAQTNQHQPRKPDATALGRTFECHARGAILVSAVFHAFLAIYKSRIADLLRIASGGTGILPAGALPPDLVNRLADEAAKSAQHVLTMCVRALDYLPPVDVTFGEYLRALLTADYDLVRDDPRHYRAAFIDSFRQHGIYPGDVRALSEDTLLWQAPTGDYEIPGPIVDELVWILKPLGECWTLRGDREEIHNRTRRVQERVHGWLRRHREEIAEALGLVARWRDPAPDDPSAQPPPAKIEVHSVRPAQRIGPNGETNLDVVIEIAQRCWVDAAGQMSEIGKDDQGEDLPTPSGSIKFRGGCTLVVNTDERRIRYVIYKKISNRQRQQAQRRYWKGELDAPQGLTYGVQPPDLGDQPFAVLHRGTQRGDLP